MLTTADLTNNEVADNFFSRDQVHSLFHQPDVLLVHEYLQVYQSTSFQLPEMRLMAAILKDAIDCYIKYLNAKKRRGKRIFKETEEWFFSRDEIWFYSFENVSAALNLEADYIRRALLGYKQQHPEGDIVPPRELARNVPQADFRMAS